MDWSERLHEMGLRSTPARSAVLEVISATSDHLSADEIAAEVEERDTDIHRSTVFRTLKRLVSLEVLEHIHLPHGATTYHVRDGRQRMHLHVACRFCESVDDIDAGALDRVATGLLQQRGFELEPTHSALSGTCVSCADAADRGEPVDGKVMG